MQIKSTRSSIPASLFLMVVLLEVPIPGCIGCLLCPLHIPARPKPLDQFRLPSIQKLVQTAENIEWLCQNGSRLASVSSECRAEVSHLFCSLSQMAMSLKAECPGPENSAECAHCRAENDLLYMHNKWILTWVDSIGKMPSGISDGNYHWLGDYEQCQRLKNQKNFNGRYCLLEFRVPDAVLRMEQCPRQGADPLEVVLGICLPANCTVDETHELVEYVADHQPIQVNCEPATVWPLPGLLLVGICMLWLFTLFAMSLLHWFRPSLQFPAPLAALCLQRHLQHCLRTTSLPPGHFNAIPGMQVLTVCLFVLGQAQVWVMPYLENIGNHYALLESWLAQPALHSTLLSDSLFAFSAFQFAVKNRHYRDGNSLPVFRTLLRRFLRFWPAYALITLGVALAFAHLGDGPMWSRTDLALRCGWNWPENLLLIQNLFGYTHTCLDAGQLLALEAQFFVFSLLALRCYCSSAGRLHTLFLPSMLALFLLSSIFVFVALLLFIPEFPPLPPTFLPHRRMEPQQFGPFVDLLVLNPLARAGPPLFGLLFAIQFSPHLGDSWTHLLRAFSPLGTIVALVGMALLLWTPAWLFVHQQQYQHPTTTFSSLIAILYAIFHRPAWAALALSLLFWTETTKDGILAKFLGWRVFRPLAKQVYPVLLLAEPLCLSLFASLHRPVHTTPLAAILSFVGILVCSFLFAFAIDITLTRPIRQLMLCCNGGTESTGGGEERMQREGTGQKTMQEIAHEKEKEVEQTVKEEHKQ